MTVLLVPEGQGIGLLPEMICRSKRKQYLLQEGLQNLKFSYAPIFFDHGWALLHF